MANRQARRKRNIKDDRKIITNFEDESVPSVLKVCLIVAVVLIAFYFMTLFLTDTPASNDNTADNNTKDNTPATIQYDEILAGETFNMNNDEYYVMFYNFNDSTAGIYKAIVTNYTTANVSAKIYTVDLSKGINATYMGDIGNPSVSSIENLKVNGPTLIKIKNGLKVSYGEGKDAIKSILK